MVLTGVIMKHCVISAVMLICCSLLHPMEESKGPFTQLKKINLLRKKTKNKIYFYNESEFILLLYYGKKKPKILDPKGSDNVKLKIRQPLTIKTGDLSQQFSLDEYQKCLQRFKIDAKCTHITINSWEEGSKHESEGD